MVRKLAHGILTLGLALAAGAAWAESPWHNPNNPLDVDNNGAIRPRDVLLIANQIQSQQSPALAGLADGPEYFWDTSNDNKVTPRDALLVVNHLLMTPEPSSIVTAALAVLGLGGYCWRRRRTRLRPVAAG
jgi:MYXO-CTERM domain-containing protein